MAVTVLSKYRHPGKGKFLTKGVPFRLSRVFSDPAALRSTGQFLV